MTPASQRASVLDRLPSGGRVSIIRLRSLGDCVLTTPALSLLKAFRPDLKIQMVVEPRFSGVFEGNSDVDDIAAKPTACDLVLNFHGGTRSMQITLAARAKIRAGFAHHRYSFIYSDKIPTAQHILGVDRAVHTAEHLAAAMFWLGVPQTEIPRAKLAGSPSHHSNNCVIHPFASAPEKAWPIDRFVAVASEMKKSGIAPIIVAGPGDDASAFKLFEVLRGAPLQEVKNTMAGAVLFIGNDSGPAHIAAAFGVPAVVIFGPSDPVTWAPWKTEARVLTSLEGIGEVSLESVLAATGSLRTQKAKA